MFQVQLGVFVGTRGNARNPVAPERMVRRGNGRVGRSIVVHVKSTRISAAPVPHVAMYGPRISRLHRWREEAAPEIPVVIQVRHRWAVPNDTCLVPITIKAAIITTTRPVVDRVLVRQPTQVLRGRPSSRRTCINRQICPGGRVPRIRRILEFHVTNAHGTCRIRAGCNCHAIGS